MPSGKKIDDAVFTVSLDGIGLSPDQVERIDKGIKETVMRELALIDNRGDLIINRKLEANPKFKGIRLPIWVGIWIEDFDIFKRRLFEQVK
ncbi:MAG TPA: hypothetical protein PKE06_04105 [Flavilitoribacter sp.]|nr:hypothetical protein [Flavilitoribacter sp.]HMQ87131.1 hypothetical protein [Flavilitoribacter sp.]